MIRASGQGVFGGIVAPPPTVLPEGFCPQELRHRNTDPKTGKARQPNENTKNMTKNQNTYGNSQGPCPDLKGFCIKALTVGPHYLSCRGFPGVFAETRPY